MKFYKISLFCFLACIILAIIYIIPYRLNFYEEEKVFNNANISVIAPNRGEQKIRLEAGGLQYWVSCYGFDDLCKGMNINQVMEIKKVRILLNNNKPNFLNGIFLEFYKKDQHYFNKQFFLKKNSLLFILADKAIFSLKLAGIFLLLSIFFIIKRV
ncbi:hypothetical protein [Neisseria chenwenguii]|uniref:hypothetical protein n=1 Tax=Neisseria chenwenguii TaxID=1853278 RepID=UPI000F4D8B06|nr:hypothetical protein [Neisseria chenwenguii]ROV51937.1 hypothetical protein EGS38_11960 [Neisseria chenwenguii]